jgi:PAS domain S-box-containing protein
MAPADTSAPTKAEEALREREALIRAIADTAVEGIVTIDERGRIESMNRAALTMFGYSLEEVLGRNVSLLMPSPYREGHDGYLAHYLHTGEKKIIGIGREVEGVRKNGEVFPLDISVTEVKLGGRRKFAGFLRDITERRRLEKEILEAGEEERRRIGRDLHDGLGQHLTSLEMVSQTLIGKLKTAAPDLVKPAQALSRRIRETITQTRLLSHNLSPVPLQDEGLMVALAELAAGTQSISGITCEFLCAETVLVPDAIAATHLYRIAQEAVNNALKHSRAKRIRITFDEQHGSWRLALEDDGRGLPASLPEPNTGVGLRMMKYRARLIGASLDIDSPPGGGVRITCTLPKAT